jgi:PP-loop superfamily ATP-utilizing enzyme
MKSRVLCAPTRLATAQAVEEEHLKGVEELQKLLKEEQDRLSAVKCDLQRFQVPPVVT